MQTHKKPFGHFKEIPCFLYEIENNNGVKISTTDYGAKLVGFFTPDCKAKIANIVVGFASVEEYRQETFYFGATVGRVAGRIRQGKATISGQEYVFDHNECGNTLHGGINTIDKQIWNTRIIEDANKSGIEFSLTSPDGANGFPGNLSIKAYYWLTDDNELIIEYKAHTDKATIVNLTNHSYYNLSGGITDIRNHELQIAASEYIEVNEELIPTSRLLPLAGSPYQFTDLRPIDTCLKAIAPRDIDTSYVMKDKSQAMIDLREMTSGRGLRIYSNQNSAQIFTSARLNPPFAGLAIEMQNFVDAPNHANFPSILLLPGEEYHNISRFVPYILNKK